MIQSIPSQSSKWMSALSDDSTSLNTNSHCVALADYNGDGDVKMIIADLGTSRFELKMKVFKGVQKIGETILADSPIAIQYFNNEQNPSYTMGVACGHTVFVYKALRPFYKYDIPDSPLFHSEAIAWERFWREGNNVEQLVQSLSMAADEISFSDLSACSQAVIMGSELDRLKLIEKVGNGQANRMPRNKSQITCMATIKRSQPDVSPVDVLVIGCENGGVHFVDTQAFQVLASVTIPSACTFLVTNGIWDVEFKVFVATRSGGVYAVKRDQMAASVDKPLTMMTRRIVGFKMFGKTLAVACDDNKITFYNFKGKRLREFTSTKRIICLETFTYEPRQYSHLMVAYERENAIVDVLKVDVDIKWIKFGPLGREEAALIIGSKVGGLLVKLFRRTAQLTDISDIKPPTLAHSHKLHLPRRTKLYIDHTQRERESSVQMHQMYQRDLFLLRCLVSQQFSLMTSKALSTLSTSSSESIDISVDVHGFGPSFILTVRLSSGTPNPLTDMWLSFVHKNDLFKLSQTLIPVSLITPGEFYKYTIQVEALSPEKGITSDIKIYLCRKNRPTPIVTAIITMPLSEMSLLD